MSMQKHPDPMDARLQAALDAQDWALLTRLCRQALRKNGRHHKAHRLLGFALSQTGDIDPALQAFRQAAALWPHRQARARQAARPLPLARQSA